jgi:HAD superfamily hydrolase (TIGR01509 family)
MKLINEKTVIFDMDGVIFDTENLSLDCWHKLAGQYGIKEVDQVYHRCIGVTVDSARQIFVDAFGTRVDHDEFSAKASELFFQYVAEHGMPMKPGVREILDYLAANDYKLGVASSTAGHLVRSQLAGRELLSYFQVVMCGDMVRRSKPAPDIFLAACEALGSNPTRSYAIEDSYNGIRAAAAAGMKAIMVPDILWPDEEIKDLAYRIFPSLLEVRDFFKKH